MTDSVTDSIASPPVHAPPRPVPLALLRVVVTLHALGVFAQPALAGLFLGGDVALIMVHAAVGEVIALLGLLQVVFAVLFWRPGRGPAWPVAASAALFVADFTQLGLGYTHVLAGHVPLGVALAAVLLLLLVWVWCPHHRRAR